MLIAIITVTGSVLVAAVTVAIPVVSTSRSSNTGPEAARARPGTHSQFPPWDPGEWPDGPLPVDRWVEPQLGAIALVHAQGWVTRSDNRYVLMILIEVANEPMASIVAFVDREGLWRKAFALPASWINGLELSAMFISTRDAVIFQQLVPPLGTWAFDRQLRSSASASLPCR